MYRPGLKLIDLEKRQIFFQSHFRAIKVALKYLSQADFQDSAAILPNLNKIYIKKQRILGHVNKWSSPVIGLPCELNNIKKFIL